MTFFDWIFFGVDIMKAIVFDFSSVGLDLTINAYEIFWGFIILGLFFEIYNYFVGGR